jgi:hypothetical protein
MDKFVKGFLGLNDLDFLKYDEKIDLYMLFSYGFLGIQNELKLSDEDLKLFQEKSVVVLEKFFNHINKSKEANGDKTLTIDSETIERWKACVRPQNPERIIELLPKLTTEPVLSYNLRDGSELSAEQLHEDILSGRKIVEDELKIVQMS